MRVISPSLFIASLLVAAACGPVEEPDQAIGGQFGEETGHNVCDLVTEVELDWDEESELGFTPNELADLLVGDTSEVLTWAGGSETGYTVSIAKGTSAFYRTYEQVDDGSGAEIDYGCDAVVAIEVSMDFSSDDGALAESWDLTLESRITDTVVLNVELDELNGSLDISSFASASYDEIWADLDIIFDEEDGVGGEIVGYGESQSSGSGSGDGTTSLTSFDIATF